MNPDWTRLPVFLASSRGNWIQRSLYNIVPAWMQKGVLMKTLRMLTPDSWMSCSLLFYVACEKQSCSWCSMSRGLGGKHNRDVHQLCVHACTETVDDKEVELMDLFVDEPFEKRDDHMFVQLVRADSKMALHFALRMRKKRFNMAGQYINFLPSSMKSIGVHDAYDAESASSFFCSEMMCSFIQQAHYKLPLVPCETTPQMLLSSLLAHYPDHANRQYALSMYGDECGGGQSTSHFFEHEMIRVQQMQEYKK